MTKKKDVICHNIKIPWVEKYRPNKTEDILLDSFIREKIEVMKKTKSIPNLIITGEPGTGKTSTVLCLADYIYQHNYNNNVLELNASDDRGLSIINNSILPFCKKKTNDMSYKLVILDEADSITPKAQNLLSNIITEFKKNTRFVFICNDYSKITESIQSKSMIIKFPRIEKKKIRQKIQYICNQENIVFDDEGIKSLLFVSNNDIRQSINNLECIYHAYGTLIEKNVYKIVDIPKPHYVRTMINNCLLGKFIDSINIIIELYDKGYSPNDILLTLMRYLLEENLEIKEKTKLKIYEIVSLSYIRVNNGICTLLQLIGCVSKIYLFLKNN